MFIVTKRITDAALFLLPAVLLMAGCDERSPSPSPSPIPNPAPLQTIAESTGGRVGTGGGSPPLALGQSVTTRQGPFNALRFSWQRFGPRGTTVPAATGRVYVLDREYAGPIAALSPSVEGVVGVAEALNDEYVFDSRITLQPGTKYWFYSNNQTDTLLSSQGNQDLYPDGEMYVRGGDRFVEFYSSPQRTERIDANFVLRGSLISR